MIEFQSTNKQLHARGAREGESPETVRQLLFANTREISRDIIQWCAFSNSGPFELLNAKGSTRDHDRVGFTWNFIYTQCGMKRKKKQKEIFSREGKKI